MKKDFEDKQEALDLYIVKLAREEAYELKTSADLDPLMEMIGDSRYVLLGEASHGTHEYYVWRSLLSKRLIREKGFSFVAVEGDWPDCYRLNRYVKNYPNSGNSAHEVLHAFNRWPTWMWANWEIEAFAEWLKQHNGPIPVEKKTGFYGLDVYSLGESLRAILNYLHKTDPNAFAIAKKAALCFQAYGLEGIDYARSTQIVPKTCQQEVVDLLKEVHRKIVHYNTDQETVFSAEQNARILVQAENYYRTMIKGGPDSWNIRDRHMVETLERLMEFHGENSKCIIWAHNTHIGDARATDMVRHGMVNIGELLTETHGEKETIKVGFGSYKGTVIAGRNWGDLMHTMHVPPGKPGSWEDILHKTGKKDLLLLTGHWKENEKMNQPIGHRAIGVVYHPEREYGNYVQSLIPMRYNAFIHLDETEALYPLHIEPDGHEMPETYPWGV